MTNKEAIEVLQGVYPNGAYSLTEEQRHEAINMAIAALANMPEESSSEDLEEELNRWRHEHFHGRRDKEADGEYLERLSQLDIARHFVNWQNEQMTEALRTEYEKGRYDMREEMVKEALDGIMGFVSIRLENPNFGEKLKEGQKVKLIIVKEE